MELTKAKVFVTVGTTKFDELIRTVLTSEILEALSSKGYNELILQVGKTLYVPDCTPRCGFTRIEYFYLSANIIDYVQAADLIISHAGAGSILDALDNKKNLIVVANESLMDNHQLELGKQLDKDKHLYYCTCQTLLNTIETMNFTELRPFINERKQVKDSEGQLMLFDIFRFLTHFTI